ncbi:hypothetical protein AAC387_Pa09g1164 [Persea americana]
MGGLAMNSKLCVLSVLLFFSLLPDLSEGSGREIESHHHVVKVSSLMPKAVCSMSKDGRKSTLTVVHRYGPCSPLGSDKLTATQMLEQDQARVDSLQSRISGRAQSQAEVSLEQATVPASSGRSMNTGNFIVTVGFGTPKNDMSLVFDTGSDVTWIQCQPCAGTCYSQQEKIFDPAQSSTYLNVSCGSAECLQVSSATGNAVRCSSSTCVYSIQYGDQSFSVGFLSHEKLTLSTDVFSNFQFGCGQNNQGLFGKTAGLLGLGRDKISFVSQTAQKYGQVFSYCLPPSPSSTGYLTFGGYKPSSAIKFTPLLTDSSNPSFYFLDFIGMAVGGRQLPISSSVFSTGGTLIDSGTVITRLPPSAYTALRSSFKQAMSKYPSSAAVSILDTCYDFSGFSTVTVPKIVMQFRGGANIDVDFSGILVGVGSSKACLAFAGNSDAGATTIIGNKQQQTFEVIYDVAKARVGFGAGGCS